MSSVSAATRRLARLRVPLGFVFAAAVFYFARPTATSLLTGSVVGLAGEALRIWAAGHLEKGREVTQSGPYRLTRHPLYVGSFVMGLGLAVACRSPLSAALILTYLGSTITAAIRTEEAFLRERFGAAYDQYAGSRRETAAGEPGRRFSGARAWRNREYRAVIGLAATMGLLALKASIVN